MQEMSQNDDDSIFAPIYIADARCIGDGGEDTNEFIYNRMNSTNIFLQMQSM